VKIASILIALAATIPVAAIAANDHQGHGAMATDSPMQSHAPAEAQWVDGLVKKVDKTAGKVTLAHGPLKNLGMDMAMTMAFRVKDAAWLDQLKVGDKIRFIASDVNSVLTVVKFEPAK